MTTAVPSTIDEALDKAADILEESGWVRTVCYSSSTGGRCALGAIATPFYPDIPSPRELDVLGFTDDNEDERHPLHVAAVDYFASVVAPDSPYRGRDVRVYEYNDQSVMSSERIVGNLRDAAEKYRQAQAA